MVKRAASAFRQIFRPVGNVESRNGSLPAMQIAIRRATRRSSMKSAPSSADVVSLGREVHIGAGRMQVQVLPSHPTVDKVSCRKDGSRRARRHRASPTKDQAAMATDKMEHATIAATLAAGLMAGTDMKPLHDKAAAAQHAVELYNAVYRALTAER